MAKKTAKTIHCTSNLKQIGLSSFSYVNDYDGVFPPYCADIWYSAKVGGSGKSRLDYMWRVLSPYGLNGQVAQCPWSKRYGAWKSYWMKMWDSRSCYFYTLADGPYYDQSQYIARRLGSPLTAPTEETIVCDTAASIGGAEYWANNHMVNGEAESQNQLKLDGHVKSVRAPGTSKRVGLW